MTQVAPFKRQVYLVIQQHAAASRGCVYMLECVSFQARKHSGSVLRDSEGHAVKHHISCVEVTTMFLLDHSF